MKYLFPNYYKKFQCIADKCEDTCCAGWQIMIDERSMEDYKNTTHPFKMQLDASIDWEEGAFKQDACRRCAFLDERNLCRLYTAMGEQSLCETCTNYPRHMEEFEDLREYTLSLSCPEVARMLMGMEEKVSFYSEEDDVEECEEDYEDFDPILHEMLQETRAVMMQIVQNRSWHIGVRMAMLWHMAEEMQRYCDEGELFAWDAVKDGYNSDETAQRERRCLQQWMDTPEKNYDWSLKLFRGLYQLELLNEDWGNLLDETAVVVYGKGAAHYVRLVEEFEQWLEKHMPRWQIQMEQLMVYFLSTYLCGAVYDGYIASKVQVAVGSGLYIYVILAGMWIKNQRQLCEEDVVDVVYRYSRELEHSDINMEELENYIDEFTE